MEDRLKHCAESLAEVERKLHELLASSHDGIEQARISEASSFVAKAIAAVSHAREEIAALPKSDRNN